ncbi:MAG: extracellular solute-binding protein [Clostridia bacterium]|nr:extracellular solute-binding protein [Clostridia bacterium]MBR3876107.1 extracellular solute-binding protein [Clostridia bacterium]
MKKLLCSLTSLLLVVIMLFGMTACVGGNPDGTGDGDGTSTDKEGNTIVKIMFHVDKSSTEGQAYQKRIDAFNAAYKDQKIKAQAIFKARSAGASGYETELQNNQLEGTLADIITFDAPNTAAYASAGLLYDISDLISKDEQDKFFSLNMYNGKLYGLPIQESSAGFFYNKKIFREAGIDVGGYTAENPWTFEQFKDVCARLKAHGVTPVDMRLDATKDETAPYLLYPFIYAAGGDFVSSDGYTAKGYYNSAETAKGFQFIKDLITAGYTSYSIGATDFFTGKVGMYLSSGWTIPDLDNKYREQFASRDDWGLLPYPKGAEAASATGSWSYAITNNHHEDKTASLELLKWMTSAESSEAITTATGMIPARRDVVKNYAQGSPEYTLLKQLELSGRERPVTVAYPTFSTTFNQIIYGLGNGNVTDLLNNATNTLQDAMDKVKK